ncbi:MAG: hypothetical protein HZR80_21020 [Candidatus Heimdallarchaeota archaeon]
MSEEKQILICLECWEQFAAGPLACPHCGCEEIDDVKNSSEVMNGLPFSFNWSKLHQPMFTTLRKSKKVQEEEQVKVLNRKIGETFTARCLLVVKYPLDAIPTSLLCYDTDTITREDAIAEIQSFYRKPLTPETIFYIHLLQKEEVKN